MMEADLVASLTCETVLSSASSRHGGMVNGMGMKYKAKEGKRFSTVSHGVPLPLGRAVLGRSSMERSLEVS